MNRHPTDPVFTDVARRYLSSQRIGRLATIGLDGGRVSCIPGFVPGFA